MIDKATIRDEALRYLAGQQSLSDFNTWLIEQTWDIPPNDGSGVGALFGPIERIIAEFDAGHRSIEDLQNKLLALVVAAPSIWIHVDESGTSSPKVQTASTSTITECSWPVPDAQAV